MHMFSTSIIRQALVNADAAPTVAFPSSTSTRVSVGIPCTSGGRITKTRRPLSGNSYSSSLLRPHVLASDRLRCWVTPHALSYHNHVISQVSLSAVLVLMEVMLSSLELKIRSNYGAGLLHFTQFCDSLHIPEGDRCPASETLLSAFIASYAGTRSTDCVNGWLAGLKFWHTFQGAPWLGGPMLCSVKKGVTKLVPDESWRDKSDPVTLDHLHCLLHHLDLSNAKDAAVYSASTIAFHSVCRCIGPSLHLMFPSYYFDSDRPNFAFQVVISLIPLNMFPTTLRSFLILLYQVFIMPTFAYRGPRLKGRKEPQLSSPTLMTPHHQLPPFVTIYLPMPRSQQGHLSSHLKRTMVDGNHLPNQTG